MNKKQYNKLSQLTIEPNKFSVSDLIDKSERTLLWGYTCDRDSFHVYLYGGKINLYVYSYHEQSVIKFASATALELDSLIPNKRVYPEASDYEFCKKLLDSGVHIQFTTFNENREPKQFYGAVKGAQKD